MERVVNTTRSFEKAAEWDVRQQVTMTPRERMRVARALKERAYPSNAKDVRACHVNYVGLDALIRNKKAAARPKDMDDLPYLTEAFRGGRHGG